MSRRWVGVPNRRQQQPLGLFGASGDDDLQPRAVREVALDALAVVHAAMAHSTAGRPNRDVAGSAARVAVAVPLTDLYASR